MHRTGWLPFLVLALAAGAAASAGPSPSPNLLRNSGFLQCANPGVPDWWGTGAPENIREWKGCYGTVKDAPLPGIAGLRLACPEAGQGISVQSYAHSLPSGRDYAFSIYLKASSDAMKATLRIGDKSTTQAVTREWQRYTFTAVPKQGHWAGGRLVVAFGVQGPGTLWVAAPQLEYGNAPTSYVPADTDAAPRKASVGPTIPPKPLPLPEARCPKTATPPVLDGKLDDACYASAARLGDFREMATGTPAGVQTETLLLRDDANLYIAFRCREPEMAELVARVSQRDGGVFADDSVEIFLQPDPKSPDYLHFAANALGTRFDEKQYDTGWNAEWQALAGKGDGEWALEIAIPFKALGLTPRTAETWRANFCRNRPHGSGPAYSAWSCPYIGYHVPERFGKVSGFARRNLAHFFVSPPRPAAAAPAAGAAPPPLAATFEYSYYTREPVARLWVESRLDAGVALAVDARSRGSGSVRSLAKPARLTDAVVLPGGRCCFAVGIQTLPEGEWDAAVTALDASGRERARVTVPLVKLAPAPVEVKMHRVNRGLVVNGKPFLCYAQGIHGMKGGWWLDDIAAHGFNTVIAGLGACRSDEELAKEEPRVRAFLDEAQGKGLKVILWLHPGAGAYAPMREAVVRTITRLKDHPNILLWYLVDEPEGWWAAQEGEKKEEDLVDLYRAAKAADPYRPAHINWYAWSHGKGGYGSLDATDIGALDRYPVGRGKSAVAVTGDIVRLMNEDCRPRRQPTAFWAQQYGYDDAVREPTVAEEAGMTYVSLIQGMRLVYYFIYKPMSVDLWESMKPLGEELRALEPVLGDPDAQELAVGTAGSVHYCLWRSGGKEYLIACNASDDAAKLKLDLGALSGGKAPRLAKAWFGAPAPRYRSGKLEATLGANARLVVELGG